MLVSFQRLASKMTDQLMSYASRTSFNSCAEISHKMETKQQHMPSSTTTTTNGSFDSPNYEDAVKALHNLQSNAETIAKARQNLNRKVLHNIPNMIRYILRSGLTMNDVDKLSVIHVSGTKGKGSTCAFCERILYCHGYKTGLFTSPHMIEVRERIQINGRPISQELFSKYFWKVYHRLQTTLTETEDGGGMPPYFAFLTVLSLHVFLSEGVDVAVVEVGIGGQYDSTNFFRNPVVCGVTSLGLDHTALLGNTITEIAWNKAGIFKPGRPAITVEHERAALEVLWKRSVEIQNPLYIAKEMSDLLIQSNKIQLGIAGAKQAENASLAIQLFYMWQQLRHNASKNMTEYIPKAASSMEEIPQLQVSELDDATIKALSLCVWPGRAQTIHRTGLTYYLDGAHTKESMQVCVQWFQQAVHQDTQHNKKYVRILLFNTTSDRDVGSLLACLMQCHFDAVLFCTNLLSTVESFNRADQLNKTVSPKFMMEKVDMNQSIWDELVTKDRSSLTFGLNGCDDDDDEQHVQLCDKKYHKESDHKLVLDHNLNQADIKLSTKSELSTEIDQEYKKYSLTKYLVTQETFGDSHSEPVYQSASQVEETVCQSTSQKKEISSSRQQENQSTTDSTTIKLHKENKKNDEMLQETINNFVLTQDTHSIKDVQLGNKQSSSLDDILLNHNQSSVYVSPEQSQARDLTLSMKFSCILHALAWATQGRDPSVTVHDPEFVVPFIPSKLLDADHVQILVTGSLHLVGGVLGVVDPHMND